jgi:hypothetical protein
LNYLPWNILPLLPWLCHFTFNWPRSIGFKLC